MEKKLTEYIDSLNKEQKPIAHSKEEEAELNELFQTVRLVRSLKEPAMPDKSFSKNLIKKITHKAAKKHYKNWLWGIGSIAAIFAIIFTVSIFSLQKNNHIVYAMEQAFQEIKAYHGFMEIQESFADGTSKTQATLEVWADKNGQYYVKKLSGTDKDMITANNGKKKWQIKPEIKEVTTFPAFPDDYHFTFEIGQEINDMKNALSTKEIGEEMIAGKKATIIEVTPKGGKPYKIWIDEKTKMPLKKQLAMNNAIQYEVSYTSIEYHDTIPNELITYHVPSGYTEITTHPEQVVSINEAAKIVGFTPIVAKEYKMKQIAVNTKTKIVKSQYALSHHTVVLFQGKASGAFTPSSTAMIGNMNENKVEIQSPIESNLGILASGTYHATNMTSIRWQQDGYEYAIVGDASLDELRQFVKNITGSTITLPQTTDKPKVEVPVNMEIEKNEQQNADAGHSIYKLDPIFATQVFVSLKISPQGIIGDYPIKLEDLSLIKNNGIDAIVEVHGDVTPISKVYLKRLVRQDSTGIWTVIGYDPK